jgi:hypothetical protein
MDSSPRQTHPVTGSHNRLSATGGGRRTRILRASFVALAALTLAFVASAIDLRHQGSVAAAPGDGFLKPNPQNLTILQGYRVALPVAMTTCANAANEQCHIGAYDVTVNYNPAIFTMLQEGRFATSATNNTITDTTATWKINQWAGAQIFLTNGPGFGQKRYVASNTATTITVTQPWNPPPSSQPGAGTIFNVGGITDAGFLGSTGRTVNCLNATYGSGTAQLQCITLGAEVPGPTGTGNLTWLNVQATGRGISTVSLTNVQVLEIDGDAIPVDIFNGARRVILCPDPNGDGRVTSIDLSLIAQQFGKHPGDPGYTTTRDPNEDGTISSPDLSLTAQVFNQKCVQP